MEQINDADTAWVLTSAALITALAPAPVNTPADFLRHVVMSNHGYLFELWLIMGALMAAPLFASSASRWSTPCCASILTAVNCIR